MAALARYQDSGLQPPSRTVSGLKHGSSSSYTEWQTPQVSGKPPSRMSVSHGTQKGASLPEGVSASERADDFCNASDSTSFQPIRSQVAIPTAHIVPSTTAPSSSNTRLYDRAGLSTESAVHSCPFVPSAIEDTRKFEMPNIEPTMNQSALLNTLCTDGRADFPTAVIRDVEPYRALPERKEIGGAEVTDRARYQSSHLQSWGRQPDSYSSQTAAEYSSWKLQQQYGYDLRMRMEKLQLVRDYSAAPLYSAGLNPIPNEWERVVKASDNILLEKEVMLERQRQHIAVLEQKLREGEVKVHSTLLTQSSPYSDMCMMRIQDLQREVTFLRAQFSEKSESASQEKADLEKKLCAMEAESRGLREAMKELAQKHSDEMKKQEERVKGRERHINSLKKKCQKEAEQNKEKQQRIETLERYMADLPTTQEHQNQVLQMKELQEQNCLLMEKVSDLEKKLRESRANCRESESQLADQKIKELEHLETIESLRREIKKLEMTDWKKEEKRLLEEADKLRQEVESLHKEQDCLQKVIENHKKRMEQMCSKVKSLEEQVCQEEATGQALKEESQHNEAALQQLKAAVRDLVTQNQDLMESNVTMQEQLRLASLKAQPLDVQAGQLFTLYKEMNHCQKNLRSICCLLSQRVQGVDPNLSMLLGVHSTSGLDEQEDDFEFFSVERYLNGIDKLKRDIEELRTTISDCYAQDMGNNCIAQ